MHFLTIFPLQAFIGELRDQIIDLVLLFKYRRLYLIFFLLICTLWAFIVVINVVYFHRLLFHYYYN